MDCLPQEVKGKNVSDLLPDIVIQAVQALPIAKRMRWGSEAVEFARPVHSVILMYGKKVIPAEILGCKTSNVTEGHRFMADKPLKMTRLPSMNLFWKSRAKSLQISASGVKSCAQKHMPVLIKRAKVVISDELLDEVTGLVEYPVAFMRAIRQGIFKRFPRK